MPTLLDDRLVQDALTALPDWTGDATAIRRTVPLSGEAADRLVSSVAVAADAMDHHPEVTPAADGVTFVLRTHSAGGVTEYDIALASRIDDLVRAASGQGVVAGAPTPEGEGSGRTGLGRRADGTERDDVAVPATPEETTERGESLAPAGMDQGEPMVGSRSTFRETPGVPLPDTVPDEPQPGIARPEGQGTPPAGQNVELPADEGGPGDRS